MHGEVLQHVLDLRVLPQLTMSGPFPVQVPVEGHHSLGEDHEVVHQLVERCEVSRVLVSRAREFLVEPVPRRSCSAGQARPEGDVQPGGVRTLQLLHGVVEALRSGQVVRDREADRRAATGGVAVAAEAGVLAAAVLHEEPVGEALVGITAADSRCDHRDLARRDGHEEAVVDLVGACSRHASIVLTHGAAPRPASHPVPRDKRDVRGALQRRGAEGGRARWDRVVEVLVDVAEEVLAFLSPLLLRHGRAGSHRVDRFRVGVTAE